MSNEVKQLLEFGPFRLDPQERVLIRDQQPVPLSPKAFDLLLVLVERSGKVVLKDDLMKLLWPDTFVEESNLGQHIFLLRKALGDRSQDSSYIVTVPGRGYRFVHPVRTLAEESVVLESHTRSRVTIEDSSPTFMVLSRMGRKPWNWVLGLAVLLVAGFAAYRMRRPPPMKEADSVLVSDFVNTTAEPIFDEALKQALTVKLAESPYFNVVLDGQTRRTLGLMKRSPDERVVPPIAREVCQREGAKVVIGGSILRLGSKYALDLDATSCLTGDSVAHEKIEAANQDQVLRQLGQAIDPLRRKLGESLSSIQKFDTPIEQATTKSLPALKAYTEGDHKRAHGQEEESIAFYKMAIELDPEFAIAYARLGTIYNNLQQQAMGDEYLRNAFERRGHISEREKLYIQAHYYEDSTAETEKAIGTYQLWAKIYPHDWIAFNNLANDEIKVGNVEGGVDASQRALQLNSNHAFPYATLSLAYQWATRFPEAKAVGEKARSQQFDNPTTHRVLYRIALMEGDEKSAQQEVEWAKGNPFESIMILQNATYKLSLGRINDARKLFDLARAKALETQPKELAGSITQDQGQYEADLGYFNEAKKLADFSLTMLQGSPARKSYSALIFARAGDSHRAELVAQESAKAKPSDFLMNKVTLACVRAATDLNKKDTAAAIAELEQAAPFDLSDPSKGVTIYYRGLAFLQQHSGKEAAVEFQKILDNRGPVDFPYWSLAHLGLARAYAMTGEKEKSLSAYREFFELWKNADHDIPLLRQANAEYAALR